MAQLFFSNERFLVALAEQQQKSRLVTADLLQRLGVGFPTENQVTMLVISKNSFDGFDALFSLAEACEKFYRKEVDVDRMRVVVFLTVKAASRSPHLEKASFIFIPDENLLDVGSYPELEKILPFR